MDIKLYKNISSSNTIQPTLQHETVISGVFNEEVNLRNPTIKIGKPGLTLEGFRKFNYCEFNGFKYFIENITINSAGMCIMDLKCDVLNSFSELNSVEILAEKGYKDELDYKLPNTTKIASPYNKVRSYIIHTISTEEKDGMYAIVVSTDGNKTI